jgi:solute carrier family 35 (UDP-galactose transporter), member B1
VRHVIVNSRLDCLTDYRLLAVWTENLLDGVHSLRISSTYTVFTELNKNKMSHGHGGHDEEKHAGYGWLLFCVIGMMSSLTLYGIVLEYATSGGRELHELSFVFVTTSIYSITAFVARSAFGEKPTQISKYQMLTLSLTSIASTFTSVRSLRYVIYPVQVLFKSCKPVPVMVFGIVLGKKYPLRKYVNVIIITSGVALFMVGGSSSAVGGATGGSTMMMGALMLSVSLCFDGATGAYEDKLMAKDHVEPFDLMYNIQLGKAVISFCSLVASNGLGDFVNTIGNGGMSLVILGLTGALGQVCCTRGENYSSSLPSTVCFCM